MNCLESKVLGFLGSVWAETNGFTEEWLRNHDFGEDSA